MPQSRSNIGHVDALARRIVAGFAVLAGVVSLNGFFFAMPFLSWLVLAFMFCTGLFFVLAGWRGGTAIDGVVPMALAVLDGWLAVTGRGQWALLAGLIVAADEFATAQLGWSPVNALLGRDTHDADADWTLKGAH